MELKNLLPRSIREAIRLRFMRGATVYCPVCENGAIAYLPSGTPPRPHAICAFCGSLERTRVTWLYLKKNGSLDQKISLLHIAPDKSLFKNFRRLSNLGYTAGDKFESGYKWPAGTIYLDITDLQFNNDQFDLIICSHVLEHVPNDRKALKELFRVMKPGGYGILDSPVDEKRELTYEDPSIIEPEERLKHFGQFDHVRIYGRDYVDRLKAVGFEVSVEDPSAQYSYIDQFRYGLNKSKLYVVAKPHSHEKKY